MSKVLILSMILIGGYMVYTMQQPSVHDHVSKPEKPTYNPNPSPPLPDIGKVDNDSFLGPAFGPFGF
jgi:hypothetical protein